MAFTVKEFAEALGAEVSEAYGITSYMRRCGFLVECGERKPAGSGKGKGAATYEFATGSIVEFSANLSFAADKLR